MPSPAADVVDARIAAFVPETQSGGHIVDVLIQERCPSFVSHWTWPVVRPALYQALGYRKAVRWANDIAALGDGVSCFRYLDDALKLEVRSHGLGRVPAAGRAVVISNHPTGLADGPATLSALHRVREDVEVFANADACRVNPAFADVIIPVEWVEEKRSPKKTRETLRRASAAFAGERLLLIFPSGRLALKRDGKLVERDWFSTAVSLARKNKAPVTPMHVKAQNSPLFYFFSKVSRELKDITLFKELLNKQGDVFELTFGPQIAPEELAGDAQAVTDRLRTYVTEVLPGDPDRKFGE